MWMGRGSAPSGRAQQMRRVYQHAVKLVYLVPEFRIRLEISENLPTQVNKEIEGIKNKIL